VRSVLSHELNTVEIEITSKKDRKSYFGVAITDVMTGLHD